MSTDKITVREAVSRGIVQIDRPYKVIMIITGVLSIILVVFRFSWWDFMLIPIGLLSSFVYTSRRTAKWRLWAYEHVEDIHQLQRSAELAGLLTIGSPDDPSPFMSGKQKEKLVVLQERFQEEVRFIDDRSLPDEMLIHSRGSSYAPGIILDNSGIRIPSTGNYGWNEINDERIARITFYDKRGKGDALRFETPDGRIEIALDLLKTNAWELDFALYIYKGRFEQKSVQKRASDDALQ